MGRGLPAPLRAAAAAAAVGVILAGLLALLGWEFDVEVLKHLIPGRVAMNPVTALAFVLGGALASPALMGDLERCPGAGRSPAADAPGPGGDRGHTADADATVFDLPGALARVRGKRPLLRKLAGFFVAECPGLLDQIRAALAAGDALTLERTAHRLKGSAANLSAPRVVELAGRLEAIGHGGRFDGADAARAGLEDAIIRLRHALGVLEGGGDGCES